MANQFSADDLAEYKSVFAKFDKTGDGKVTVSEMGTVWTRVTGTRPAGPILDRAR